MLEIKEHDIMSEETKDLGRNDPCHCGSGKKYKKCCLEKDEAREREDHAAAAKAAAEAAAAAAPAEGEEKKDEKPSQHKHGRDDFHGHAPTRGSTTRTIFQRKSGGA